MLCYVSYYFHVCAIYVILSPDTLHLFCIEIFIYILAIVYILFEGCVPKQFCFMMNFVLMLMTFLFGSGIKLILIITDLYYMLLLAAATHSLITELA